MWTHFYQITLRAELFLFCFILSYFILFVRKMEKSATNLPPPQKKKVGQEDNEKNSRISHCSLKKKKKKKKKTHFCQMYIRQTVWVSVDDNTL